MNQIAPPLLSVVVTAHNEGMLLRPTLNSLLLAVLEASAKQMACEIVILLDNPDKQTKEQAELFLSICNEEVQVTIIEANLGDPGLSRNAGVKVARGRYIALCDGDDLVSPNYFCGGLTILMQSESPLILHAEYVLSFGARSILSPLRTSKIESANYLDLVYSNLWPSASISQSSTFKNHPYSRYNPSSGYGPEDWVWNLETSAQGIQRDVIPNSIYCYRTKLSSGVNNTHQSSILPLIDIDQLRQQLPVHKRLREEKSTFSRSIRSITKQVGKPILALSRILPGRMTSKVQTAAGKIYRQIFNIDLISNRLNAELVVQLKQITNIEPAISNAASQWEQLPTWDPVNSNYTQILEHVLHQLRGNQKAIVWVPWLGIGGADMVALNYATALKQNKSFNGEISLIATYKPEKTIRNLIPKDINFIQLPIEFRELPDQEQRRLIAQVFIQSRPQLCLSINCFDVTNALNLYSKQMADHTDIFLSLFAFDHISHGYPVNPITDDAERNFICDLQGIITDNSITKIELDKMLGFPPDFVKVHKQPVFLLTPPLEKNSAAFISSSFDEKHPFKLLWPHRLDKEKSPKTLIQIAEIAKSKGIPIEITVYGQQVLNSGGESLLSDLKRAGIKYMGPYQGGLAALPYSEFHAMLLTSESEGMPLVVVQSMFLGLPVISTNVGGIPDLIIDSKTGFLAQSPEDIDGFIKGIECFMDLDQRRLIIENAYNAAVNSHSWDSFISHSVSELV